MFTIFASTDPDRVAAIAHEWCSAASSNDAIAVWTDQFFTATADTVDAHVSALGRHVVAFGTLPGQRAPSMQNFKARPLAARLWCELFEHADAGMPKDALGAFSFAAWSRAERQLIAVRDPLGLKTLYYRSIGSDLLVSDRLEGFDHGERCDSEFIAEFIASLGCCADRTIWSGISPVSAGSMLRWTDGRASIRTYWSTDQPASLGIDIDEAAREFRSLTEEAVLAHIEPDSRTWAHLSGGLDSSSVVSMAGVLSERTNGRVSLGGTITMTSPLGDADETPFSDAVVRRFNVRNAQVSYTWPWRDDGEPLPVTDQPSRDYPFYARDRDVARIVRTNGGTSILSGIGPDRYLLMTPSHIPDLAWQGALASSWRELCDWTVLMRDSLWRTALSRLLAPLLSPECQFWWESRRVDVPRWFTPTYTKRYELRRRLTRQHTLVTRRGTLYQSEIATQFKTLSGSLPCWCYLPGVAVKHPLLYQPLVEFALSLPSTWRSNPRRTKSVLRLAMDGRSGTRTRG